MHLALIRQSLTSLGGAEMTLVALAQELLRQGHEVTILSRDVHPPPPLAGRRRLHWQPVPVWPGKVGRLLGFALNCRRLVRSQPFDLVYSLERTLVQDAYRAGDGCHREWLRRRWPYESLVQRCHLAASPFHRTLLALEKRLLHSPRLRLVIANSRQVKAELQRHYRVEADKIQVIYNGVDHERFYPAPPANRSGPPEILFVGSGFKRKGLAYLIMALAALPPSQARLLVVGQGRTGRYEKLARRLGVAHRLTFVGPQPQVEAWYRRAAVLALPTLYDPCANVVLEALACGRPVVTTAANGAAEFITPGRNGAVLTRPDDIPGLVAALAEFLDRAGDPRLSQAAAAAVAHLSWPQTVATTLAALQNVAGA